MGLFDTISDAVSGAADYAHRTVSDPVGAIERAVMQPVEDAIDVLDGLSEGELRTKAALRLGTDVVAGMTFSAVLEFLGE